MEARFGRVIDALVGRPLLRLVLRTQARSSCERRAGTRLKCDGAQILKTCPG